MFAALIRRTPADVPFPLYMRNAPQAVRRSASSINNPSMEDRFVKRLHKEFDEAVKAGKQEGFTVCLVNDDIINWVVKFYGPVS